MTFSLAICIIGFFVSYLSLDKVDTVMSMQSQSRFENFAQNCTAIISGALSDPDVQDAENTWILGFLEEGVINPYTQAPLIVEDSPGNLTIEREDGIISRITFYRKNGAAIEWQ